jgi:hypothetical protein
MELTRSASAPGVKLPVQLLAATLAALAALFILSVLVTKLGALIAMAVVAALLMGCALCLLPRAAAFVAVFLLYSNLVVIFAGSPLYQVVGASSAILLALPVADQLLIRGQSPRFDRVFGLMIVFLVVLLVSAFLAEDIRLAIKEIVQYVTEGLLIYLLLINVVRSTHDLHRVMAAGVLACAVLSMMTIYQVVAHDYKSQFGGMAQRLEVSHPLPKLGNDVSAADDEPVPIAEEDEEDGIALIDRASGPIGDPNRYAQLLLVVLPWSLYFARHGRTPLPRLAAAGTAALIMTSVTLTYSRGAFITIAVLVLCLLVWRYIRPGRLVLAGLVLAAIVGTTAPGVLARVGSIGGVSLLGKQDAKVAPDGAIKGRATEMLAALAVFLDHPFLGVGPGQYVPFYSEKYQLLDELSFRHLPRPREAHNLYFSIGAETGAAGLLVFFLIVGTLFVGLRWARRFWLLRSRRRADLAVAFSLSLVAYLGTGMFLHLSFERYLWFLVATASAAIHILRQDQLRQSAEEASW